MAKRKIAAKSSESSKSSKNSKNSPKVANNTSNSTRRTSASSKSAAPSSTPREKRTGTIAINEQVWPIERDVFFRPARLKYVRKLVPTQGCVFCNAAEAKPTFETLCVYKSEHTQIILNKYPYNSGHLLVLPIRHCGDFLELSSKEYQDLHETLRLAVQAVQKIYQPSGFNLGMNHGATGGAGIPDHLHYHIVPRWNGDLNFFPLIAETKLVIEDLEDSYARYKKYFDNLNKERE